MKLHFSYGKSGLDLTLPEDRPIEILRARPQRALDDTRAATAAALADPIDSRPLAEIARGRREACVVISDITRPVPNREILPPILQTIEEAGIARGKITILIATGIHRPNEGEELIRLVGAEIASRYRVVNHMADEEAECRSLGATRSGIPVLVNRRYLAADLKILTGLIEPHLWAGFSGGCKSILPGITSLETMKRMHGPDMIDACIANCGSLEGNAFHEAGLEVAEMAGVDFIVNLTVDENKRPTGIFAGHYREAHHQGARRCEAATGFFLEEPADLVIASGGGFPLDTTFYQAVKGMSMAWLALREGGQSLVTAECSEGFGSRPFTAMLENMESPAQFLETIRQPGFFEVDQWTAQVMARILLENRVAIHATALRPDALARHGFEPVADPQSWVDEKIAALAPEARVVVVPDGPYVYARVGRPVG